jgi:hypothetical protein
MSEDPIVATRRVAVSASVAFVAFTTRMGDWWDPRLTPDPPSYDGIRVEPFVGGSVTLLHIERDPFPIGEVTEWEPGRRYAQTFTLALPEPTILRIDFVPDGDGTLVTLIHTGWGPGNSDHRSKFTEWPQLLERYAEAAESSD